MAVCRHLDVEDEEEGVRNSLKFLSLRDLKTKLKLTVTGHFANTCLLLGGEDELRFSHVRF